MQDVPTVELAGEGSHEERVMNGWVEENGPYMRLAVEAGVPEATIAAAHLDPRPVTRPRPHRL